MTPSRNELVVLVHGIWMPRLVMHFIARYLRRSGYTTHEVSYAFLARSPEQNADTLYDEIAILAPTTLHLVGHSLGGIVLMHLLDRHPSLPPGKVVLLGSPVRGSDIARRLHTKQYLRPLLGRSVERGLLGGAPVADGKRPVGVITGSRRFGLSALFRTRQEQSDGTVAESETRLSGSEVRITLPYSHSTMLFSTRCAEQIVHFLQAGRFRT